MATNANETIYGPVADAAAIKYGLDPAMFRRLIMSESSFDPNAINPQSVNGQNAIGIAQFLPSTASPRGIDPLNPYSALDGAAKYVAELTAKYGPSGAIATYKGYSDINSSAAQTAANKIVGISLYPDGVDPLGNQMGPDALQLKNNQATQNDVASKPFWRYTLDDFKTMVQSGAWGLLFGFLGLLVVIFSIYMLTKRGATGSIDVVKNAAGV